MKNLSTQQVSDLTVNISDHVDADQLHTFDRLVCVSLSIHSGLMTHFKGHCAKYQHLLTDDEKLRCDQPTAEIKSSIQN